MARRMERRPARPPPDPRDGTRGAPLRRAPLPPSGRGLREPRPHADHAVHRVHRLHAAARGRGGAHRPREAHLRTQRAPRRPDLPCCEAHRVHVTLGGRIPARRISGLPHRDRGDAGPRAVRDVRREVGGSPAGARATRPRWQTSGAVRRRRFPAQGRVRVARRMATRWIRHARDARSRYRLGDPGRAAIARCRGPPQRDRALRTVARALARRRSVRAAHTRRGVRPRLSGSRRRRTARHRHAAERDSRTHRRGPHRPARASSRHGRADRGDHPPSRLRRAAS